MIQSFHYPWSDLHWQLELKQTYCPKKLLSKKSPLLLIPGYGMNTFIFGYHPSGLSMEAFFAKAGFEVWSANLRGQGKSKCLGEKKTYGFEELALVDLPSIFEAIQQQTKTESNTINAVGCSLGATLLFIYLAHHSQKNPLQTLISIGGPLRWERIHPLLQTAFFSTWIAGKLPIYGTRQFASFFLPIAKHFPSVLSIYMNSKIVDLRKAKQLTQTVENPHPRLNRQIAHWIKQKDLSVAKCNITKAMAQVNLPLLCVLANRDGIVLPKTAVSIIKAIGSEDINLLEVGDDKTWFAHADLFISQFAKEKVFQPILEWLLPRA